MLTGAGLGNHARLAHATRQQRLTDGVVDLVRAGMVQVFALEVDLRAAELVRPALGVIDRAGPSNEMLELILELGDEIRIGAVVLIGLAQVFERMHQRLGNEGSTVRAEVTASVGKVIRFHVLPASADSTEAMNRSISAGSLCRGECP